MVKKEYTFDAENHIHFLDGVELIGVTTALSVIAKPALVPWAAKMVYDHVVENAEWDEDGKIFKVSAELLLEAKGAHAKKKDTAGDWGTIMHKAIEKWVTTGMQPSSFPDENAEKVFKLFQEWWVEFKWKALESEKPVWSEKMGVGGILDLKAKMGKEKYLCDIKTSSRIYDEHFYQIGGYDECLKEMGDKDKYVGYVVINLRKDGKIDVEMRKNTAFYRRAFKAALELYKITKEKK